jgi:hypothetical protein
LINEYKMDKAICSRYRWRPKLVVILSICILMIAVPIRTAWSDNVNQGIYSIDSKIYGHTYTDWTIKFWQWLVSIPTKDPVTREDKNPTDDASGKYCAVNQNGPVWFLTGSTGTVVRSCTIPAGKAILVLIIGNECSFAEYPQLKTEAELRNCAVTGDEGISSDVKATLDGRDVQDINMYRLQSPLFDMTLANPNIFGAPAGPTKAVSDGWWLILEPLPPGTHEIHFSGQSIRNPTTGAPPFGLDVSYHLTVNP